MKFWHDLIPPALMDTLGWVLLHSLWQGALLMLLLGMGLFALRHRSANARYFAAYAALVAMVVCPLLTVIVPRSAPHAPFGLNIVHAEHGNIGAAMTSERETIPRTARSEPLAGKLEPLFPTIVALWLVGVCGLSARLLRNWALVWRLAAQYQSRRLDQLRYVTASLSLRMGMTQIPLLLESSRVEVPTVFGWLHAVILIPPSALIGLSPQALEALIAHELAHVRRHDYLFNMLQAILETLLFYHPAAWWISARIRIEREHCCDDLAVKTLGDRAVYARALATMESLRSAPPASALAANGGSLLVRVRRLFGLPHSNPHPLPPMGAVFLTLCALLGPVTLAQNAPVHSVKPVARKVSVPISARSKPVPVRKGKGAFFDALPTNVSKHATRSSSRETPQSRARSEEAALSSPTAAHSVTVSPAAVVSQPPNEKPVGSPQKNPLNEVNRVMLTNSEDKEEGDQEMVLIAGQDDKISVSPAVLTESWKGDANRTIPLPMPIPIKVDFKPNFVFQNQFPLAFEQEVRSIERTMKQLQKDIESARRKAEQATNAPKDYAEGIEQGIRGMERALSQMEKEVTRAKRRAEQEQDRSRQKAQRDQEKAQRDRERMQREDDQSQSKARKHHKAGDDVWTPEHDE